MNFSFFKPTKLKLLVFVVLFLILFMYVPVVPCVNDFATADKICRGYNLCTTDIYFPLALIVSEYEDSKLFCPSRMIGWSTVLGLTMLFAASAYLASCACEYLYRKYRDV